MDGVNILGFSKAPDLNANGPEGYTCNFFYEYFELLIIVKWD